MKAFKFLTLIGALGALFATTLPAQDQTNPSTPPTEGRRGKGGQNQGGRGQMSPQARVEQLDKALTLTAEQKTKITDIYTKAQEDMRTAMRNGSGGDRQAAREKMMEAMRATREQVRGVLTEDQQKKFDALPQRGGEGNRSKGKRGTSQNQ